MIDKIDHKSTYLSCNDDPYKRRNDEMTLNQLRYFLEIYKSGSMHRAAEKMNISQSTISIAIQNLEKELEVTLFNRRPHGLTLTPAGTALYAHAAAILDRVDQIKPEMRQFSADRHLIRFGMPPVLSLSFWPELYPFLQSHFSRYSFTLSTETRSMLKDMLTSNILDMAIIPVSKDLPLPTGFNKRKLIQDEFRSLTLSIYHPLAQKKLLTWEDVANCDLLGYQSGTSLHKLIEKEFISIGRILTFKQLCPQLSTVISLVRKNIGGAFLNRRITREYNDLVSIPIIPFKTQELYLIWRKTINGFHMPKTMAEQLAAFFEEIKKKDTQTK